MKLAQILDADWERYCVLCGTPGKPRRVFSMWGPRTASVLILRWSQACHQQGFRILAKLLSLFNFLIFGFEAPASLSIGAGLVLPHPQGTILGAASIGSNCMIYQQVTLGAIEADFVYDHGKRPVIGHGVIIGAGAKVLGGITLGDGCVVGANAVVLKDVPANHRAVGVPARNSET